MVSLINHSRTMETEKFKAEGERVLQALEAGNSDQAAANLQLLRDARLITGELEENIGEYLANRKPGQGAVIGPPRSDVIEPGLTLEFGEGDHIAALLVSHDVVRKGAYSPFLDRNEYDVSFGLSVEIAREIGNRGGKAFVLTRPIGNSMNFEQQRIQIGQRLDDISPRLGIEIHFNAAENEAARGTEVFFGEGASPPLRRLAEDLGSVSAQILGTQFRGARAVSLQDRAGYIANGPRTATLVVELFFGTSPRDSEEFQENRDQIVKAVADAISRWNG